MSHLVSNGLDVLVPCIGLLSHPTCHVLFLFLGSYENTFLWHPCWHCWGAGCKSRSSCWKNSRYVWSIPECSDFHASKMWVVHCKRWKKLQTLTLTHVPFVFLRVLLKPFSLTVSFLNGASVYINTSGKDFRPVLLHDFKSSGSTLGLLGVLKSLTETSCT